MKRKVFIKLRFKLLENLKDEMKMKSIDLSIITSNINIYYFTGFYSRPRERVTAFVFDKNGKGILLVPNLDLGLAKSATSNLEVVGYKDNENPYIILQSLIGTEFQNIYIEENIWTIHKFKTLENVFSDSYFHDISTWINTKRNIKYPEELDNINKAIKLTESGIEYGISKIRKGISEVELAAEIEFFLKKNGAESMAFDVKVVSGERSAFPHGKPSSHKISYNSFILFDMGVTYKRYCGDVSRTVFFGQPSKEHLNIYNVVKEALELSLNSTKPGVLASSLDTIAREHIIKNGYGEYFTHRLGHGLGLELHELPYLHQDSNEIIKTGMVFTVEPGIYVPNLGGVRIEDNVHVTDNGVEVLTSFSKDLIIIN